MKAIILAGGLGTRLRSVVSDVPKPMAVVGGRPFLSHLMDYWISQGVDGFILSVGYKAEVLQKYFGERYNGIPLFYVVEDRPLGTGGGLLASSKRLTEPFLLLNGDTFFDVPLQKLMSRCLPLSDTIHLSLRRIVGENIRYHGVSINRDGEVLSLDDGAGASPLVNGGVYLVCPSVLEPFRKTKEYVSLEQDMLPKLISQTKTVYGFEFEGTFIDIGTPPDYERSQLLFH